MLISAQVLDVQPHPDQATNNPGCWAVKLQVLHIDKERTFWRWHNVRRLNKNGAYIDPGNQPPTQSEVLAQFWDDTFGEMHGFDFEKLSW